MTGGAGFLGHYFVQKAHLLGTGTFIPNQAPISVVVYDSFVRGMPGLALTIGGQIAMLTLAAA